MWLHFIQTIYLINKLILCPNMVFDENEAIKSIRHKTYWEIIKKPTFNTFRASKKVRTIVFDLIKLNCWYWRGWYTVYVWQIFYVVRPLSVSTNRRIQFRPCFRKGTTVFFSSEFAFSLRIATGGDPPLPCCSSRTSRWVINKKKKSKTKNSARKAERVFFRIVR